MQAPPASGVRLPWSDLPTALHALVECRLGAPVVSATTQPGGFSPSVAMQGGPQPEELLARYPAARSAPDDAITAVVAAIVGYFTWGALQPPPPGIPTVRAFQAAQGVVARQWLARRTGWA